MVEVSKDMGVFHGEFDVIIYEFFAGLGGVVEIRDAGVAF